MLYLMISTMWSNCYMNQENIQILVVAKMLLKLDDKFNFTDYDNCPLVIVQVFENGNWRYYSDAVVDWYNL